MHCENCGENLKEEDQFCFNCGVSVSDLSTTNKKIKLSKKRMFWIKAPYFFWLATLVLFSMALGVNYSGDLMGYIVFSGIISFLFLVVGLYQYREHKEAKKYATVIFITLVSLFILLIGGLLFYSSNSTPVQNTSIAQVKNNSNYINIKYRDDVVDVNNGLFEHLNTKGGSSLVREAWYDQSNKYMIIQLNSTYYHYCGLPASIWRTFKQTNSFGTFYTSKIKGNYDCRYNYEPKY